MSNFDNFGIIEYSLFIMFIGLISLIIYREYELKTI